jgi:hypothetical protein
LRNTRKTERGAKLFLARLEVRAAPFALLKKYLRSDTLKSTPAALCNRKDAMIWKSGSICVEPEAYD